MTGRTAPPKEWRIVCQLVRGNKTGGLPWDNIVVILKVHHLQEGIILHAPECPIRYWCRAVRPWCRRGGALHGYGDSALDFRIEIPPLASCSVVTDHASWGARTWIWAGAHSRHRRTDSRTFAFRNRDILP